MWMCYVWRLEVGDRVKVAGGEKLGISVIWYRLTRHSLFLRTVWTLLSRENPMLGHSVEHGDGKVLFVDI